MLNQCEALIDWEGTYVDQLPNKPLDRGDRRRIGQASAGIRLRARPDDAELADDVSALPCQRLDRFRSACTPPVVPALNTATGFV